MALLLSCLLCNITLSEKSRQADTVVTERQQPSASGDGARLNEEALWQEGPGQRGQTGMALHVGCKMLH